MSNLFDVQCPRCKSSDPLRMQAPCNIPLSRDGRDEEVSIACGTWVAIGVGSCRSSEQEAETLLLYLTLTSELTCDAWDAFTCCDDCGYQAPIVSFEGGVADQLRRMKAAWDRLLESALASGRI